MVLHQDDAQVAVAVQAGDLLGELVDLGVGEPVGRFVQQEDARFEGDGPGQLDLLEVGQSQFGAGAIGDGLQAQPLDGTVGALGCLTGLLRGRGRCRGQ